MKKLISILVAMAMVLSLTVISAFAAVSEDDMGTQLAKSGLTKVFDVPTGVTRPAATFKYTFTPNAANPSGSTSPWTEQIQIAGGEGTETGFLRLSDVFTLTGEQGKYAITKPGVYLFTVSENDEEHATAPSIVAYDSLDITNEDVTYDGNTYVLRLYIASDGNGGLEETAITVIDEDDNNPVDDTKKIDPTEIDEEIPDDPETPDVDESGTQGTETSEWEFINYYTKSITDNTADGAFNIAKALEESAEDTAYPFTIAITVDEQTVKGYTEAEPYTLTAGGKDWSFWEGHLTATQSNVNISKDTKLVFNTFPAGATVNIVEKMMESNIANKELYTAKAEGTNIAVDSTDYTAKEVNLNRTAGVYDAKSAVTVTNKLASSDVTPTGILINNLPYIALALVAIGGLVAYVVVRRRQNDEA